MLKILDKAFFQIIHWEINKIVTYKDLNFGKLVFSYACYLSQQRAKTRKKYINLHMMRKLALGSITIRKEETNH